MNSVKSMRRWTAAQLVVVVLLAAQYPTSHGWGRITNAVLIAINLWNAVSNILTLHIAVVEWAFERRGIADESVTP